MTATTPARNVTAMAGKKSTDVVMELQVALRERDFARMHELFAADAVTRMAGMPRSIGGACEGREAILEYLGVAPRGPFEIRGVFADEENVCVTGKWHVKTFPGRGMLRAGDQLHDVGSRHIPRQGRPDSRGDLVHQLARCLRADGHRRPVQPGRQLII